MYTIYKATSPSGKIYIGLTKNLYNRKKSHKSDAKSGAKTPFHKAIRKYGWDLITWEVLEKNIPLNRAEDRETYWINKLNTMDSKNGYNAAIGGLGFPGTKRAKNKISNTLKNIYHKKPGTRLKHSRERGGRPIDVWKINGDYVGQFNTQVDCCEKLNLIKSIVCRCLSGKYPSRRSHRGLVFKYTEEGTL